MRVEEMMTRDLVVLHKRDMISRARRDMELSNIRHLPIVDSKGRLLGLVTQRDLASAGDDKDHAVSTVMRQDLVTVAPDTPAHEAAYLLLRHAIGCVPVTDGERTLVGIVTETDFVRVAYSKLGGKVPVDQIEREEIEAERV